MRPGHSRTASEHKSPCRRPDPEHCIEIDLSAACVPVMQAGALREKSDRPGPLGGWVRPGGGRHLDVQFATVLTVIQREAAADVTLAIGELD
jgi:hypothetical protein